MDAPTGGPEMSSPMSRAAIGPRLIMTRGVRMCLCKCTARKDCWCDLSWDAIGQGHQRKCQFANESLASSGAETR